MSGMSHTRRTVLPAFLILLGVFLTAPRQADAQDTLVAYRLNLVKHPVFDRYGYAFKKQNIKSPIRGTTSTAINIIGKAGSALISKDEAEYIDWAIPPQYEAAANKYSENLSMVKVKGKVGFIDIYNRFVIEPVYDGDTDIDGFHQDVAAVKKDGLYGFINKKGETVIPFEYEEADAFDDKLLTAVKKDGLWGAVDITGKMVIPPSKKTKLALKTNPVSNKEWREAAELTKDSRTSGVYDERLAELRTAAREVNTRISSDKRQPLTYSTIGSGDSIGIIDNYGRVIVPPMFSSVELGKDKDAFVVVKNGRYGAYLYNGLKLIGPCLDNIMPFKNGVAKIAAEGVTGWIDTDGYLDPNFLYTIANNGISMEKTNKAVARRKYERVLEINPEYAPAYNNLALLDIENKDYNKGMRKLKTAHELAPEDTVIAKNLKWAKESRKERRNERWQAALEIVEAIIGIAATTYTAYSSIKGNSTTSDGGSYAGSPSVSSGSSGSSTGKSSGTNLCTTCAGSGHCHSKSGTANKYYCGGSGKCKYCNGGIVYAAGTRTKCNACNGRNVCKYCNGTGKCKTCGGTGKK